MGLKGKIFKFMSDILKDGSYYKLYTHRRNLPQPVACQRDFLILVSPWSCLALLSTSWSGLGLVSVSSQPFVSSWTPLGLALVLSRSPLNLVSYWSCLGLLSALSQYCIGHNLMILKQGEHYFTHKVQLHLDL